MIFGPSKSTTSVKFRSNTLRSDVWNSQTYKVFGFYAQPMELEDITSFIDKSLADAWVVRDKLRQVEFVFLCYLVACARERSATTKASSRCNEYMFGCDRARSLRSSRFYSSASLQSPLHNLRERSKDRKTLVFLSTSNNPYHNLAIEHYLLTNSDVNSRILLFYTNRPCVVIGRNQNPWTECNLKLIQDGIRESPIELVRRRSGGGTVFHDEGNLNFSVIVPNDKDFSRRTHSELVVRALNEIHIVSAEYDGPENVWVNERHDITMATMQNKGRSEFKVSGSAFKLTRGRALHHGTLLHSSPNLESISRLLRSPGKDWIQAKGVESVRSPVMNIFNVQTSEQRISLRDQITSQITNGFQNLYGAGTRLELVEDEDCLAEINPDVAKGVKELQSDEWRFEQTPRFEFNSKVVGGKQVTFTVRNGYVEAARLGAEKVPIDQRSNLQIRRQQKIHEIQDWCEFFDPESVDDEQLATIAQVFPNLQKLLYKDDLNVASNDGLVEEQRDSIVRRLRDGTVERESEPNTIEEIRP